MKEQNNKRIFQDTKIGLIKELCLPTGLEAFTVSAQQDFKVALDKCLLCACVYFILSFLNKIYYYGYPNAATLFYTSYVYVWVLEGISRKDTLSL